MSNVVKNFGILTTFELSFYINYFDEPTKLFSDLYLVKFLDTLAKYEKHRFFFMFFNRFHYTYIIYLHEHQFKFKFRKLIK